MKAASSIVLSVVPIIFVTFIVTVLLVIVTLVIICCVMKQRNRRKPSSISSVAVVAASNSFKIYEELYPVYETVLNKGTGDFQTEVVATNEQDVFTKATVQVVNMNSECVAKGIHMVVNEAYSHSSPSNIIKQSTNYNGQHTHCASEDHHYDICSSVLGEEGYDDTVI